VKVAVRYKNQRARVNRISLRLPESLHKQARELAKKEDISINQLFATALAEKMAALMTASISPSVPSAATGGSSTACSGRSEPETPTRCQAMSDSHPT
jgi:hypothetical protein